MTANRSARIVVVLVVLALVTEVGLRLTTGLGNPPLFQKDAEIGYLLVANQQVYRLGNRIAINRFHQRSEDLSPRPSAGTERLFFLGDSITFGVASVGQSETYPELVAARLRSLGGKVEVMNASAASWGIGNELAYIERFGIFGSQIAVLQIGSSDLLQATSVGDGVGVDPNQPNGKPLTAIGELLGRFLIPRLKQRWGLEQGGKEPVTPSDRERQFQENMRHFVTLISKVRENQAFPIVLLVPGLSEVMPADGRWFTEYAPYRARFKEIARTLGVTLLDLSVEWRNDPEAPAYYKDGTHLTLAGNQALSARIFKAIEQTAATPERVFGKFTCCEAIGGSDEPEFLPSSPSHSASHL